MATDFEVNMGLASLFLIGALLQTAKHTRCVFAEDDALWIAWITRLGDTTKYRQTDRAKPDTPVLPFPEVPGRAPPACRQGR